MMNKAWLGIDVSKNKFDVAVAWSGRQRAKVFANTAAGWGQLCAWLTDLGIDQVHACLEATGQYDEGVALALHEAGHRVSLINPAQIKYFARTKLGRNKTDKLDAALIRDYGQLFEPAPWRPPSAAQRQLRDLVRVRQALQAALTEWRNRRGSGALVEAADQAIAGVIEHLEQKLDALNLTIEQTIAGDPELRAQHRLLMSVPGIATRTAATLLVELPAPGVLNSARETAAYAGLNPCQNQSGSSLHRPARISRIGNAAMRTALYLPAITAMRHNPLVRALRERLEAKGELQPMQIVAAAMRKLLHLCFGVLKTRQPFDPAWPTTPTAA